MWAVNSGNQIEALYYLDCMAEPNRQNLIMFVQSDFYIYISEFCAVSLTSWIMCMLSSVLNVVHFPNPFGRFSDVTWGHGVFMVFKYLTQGIYASGLKKKKKNRPVPGLYSRLICSPASIFIFHDNPEAFYEAGDGKQPKQKIVVNLNNGQKLSYEGF